ncbi:enoyl-CoA hydratase/isomerase family protein [Tardiphaga sp. 538_B7_N1_4]|jgi:enoyl-CoA hydratase/carnithine racemase|uniref:enoyl-CoA hydratase/isomerase family protein n=1 Tax=Tardiphaga sp. 538_B7_N1_4 TaxID=3240778 RepID=UPI002013275F|nr:enoyl-CoA hydratase/isomerase family protein [Bradyrhizobium diazoefficiens]
MRAQNNHESLVGMTGENLDLGVEYVGNIAIVEIRRPPLNYFDVPLIKSLGDALEEIDKNCQIRAVVLCAQGKAFCAGSNLGESRTTPAQAPTGKYRHPLYEEALRIFGSKKPIVAAVHGAAIGGGLGLALSADFRITCPEARFAANFTKLGYHPGFGLTVTLPDLIGKNAAEFMFYTSRRIDGRKAVDIGLANELVSQSEVRPAAIRLAQEIAECSPLGLLSTRETMRLGLLDRLEHATQREGVLQLRLRSTEDFKEGVKATAERRVANFVGQ